MNVPQQPKIAYAQEACAHLSDSMWQTRMMYGLWIFASGRRAVNACDCVLRSILKGGAFAAGAHSCSDLICMKRTEFRDADNDRLTLTGQLLKILSFVLPPAKKIPAE